MQESTKAFSKRLCTDATYRDMIMSLVPKKDQSVEDNPRLSETLFGYSTNSQNKSSSTDLGDLSKTGTFFRSRSLSQDEVFNLTYGQNSGFILSGEGNSAIVALLKQKIDELEATLDLE